MALRFICMLLVTAFASSACDPSSFGGTRAWRSPVLATPSEPPPPPPAPLPPDAVLTLSKVNVTVVPDPPDGLFYEFRFELKETGGRSGATIRNVITSVDNGQSETTGPECWGDTMRVPPGGTLIDFDSGWTDLSYCAPWSYSSKEAARYTVSVRFADDEGREGILSVTELIAR